MSRNSNSENISKDMPTRMSHPTEGSHSPAKINGGLNPEALSTDHSFSTAIIKHMAQGLGVCHQIEQFPYLKFTIWNDQMQKITGYNLDEINTTGCYQALFPNPATRSNFKAHITKILEQKDAPASEWLIVNADRKNRIIQVSASILETVEGVVHIMALVQDVSTYKASDNAHRRLEGRLQQAKKMEAIAALAGGIAHEFNNALSVITGHVDLIGMDLSPHQPGMRSLPPIRAAVDRMSDLTGQLLAYARGGKYHPKTISTNKFIEKTLAVTRHIFQPRIDLKTDIAPNLCHVHLDLTQMQMVLSAVFSNAMEAIIDKGRVLISAQNRTLDKKIHHVANDNTAHYVCVTVKDNGPGMDVETCNRIFEPFFSTKVYGRGLGMAAAYGIVKNHDGWIGVDSEPGQGTTITIYLPAVTNEPAPQKINGNRLVQGSGTILVVEDDKALMNLNRMLLEKLGYRILEARCGEEALSITRNFNDLIDIAIIDLGLPDIPGITVIQELSIMKPHTKIIACSGRILTVEHQKILNEASHSFIQKPFSFSALSAKLDHVLQKP